MKKIKGVVKAKRDVNYWSGRLIYLIAGAELCVSSVHRIFPNIRLKPGAGPIRVLMLGLPLDGLTDEQIATLREKADHLEAVCVGMRSETS